MGNDTAKLPPLRPGDRITPSLQLLRPLGAGGMGAVWIADHLGLHTRVVVKFMTDDLASNREAVARFSREAAAASQVKSPHVVQMLDHGVAADGRLFIAMELLEGESLRDRLNRERVLPPHDVATIVSQCAKALARAHERGVVHRDIKPDNIFLTDGGGGDLFAKVLDFGIAKANAGDFVATSTGAVLGSPYYMSPEQVLGSKMLDQRSDLWSLGVVTYEALTGARPFEAETIGALSIAICHGQLPAPTSVQPTLPPAIDAWFARACARDVGARFASAKELADALGAALAGSAVHLVPQAAPALAATLPMSTTAGFESRRAAPTRQPLYLWAIVAAIVALGAIGGVAVWSMRPSEAVQTVEPSVPPPIKSQPKPAATTEPAPTDAPVEVPTVVASATQSASNLGKVTKPGPAKSAQPAASAAAAPPTIGAPVPKVAHDPNIF